MDHTTKPNLPTESVWESGEEYGIPANGPVRKTHGMDFLELLFFQEKFNSQGKNIFFLVFSGKIEKKHDFCSRLANNSAEGS